MKARTKLPRRSAAAKARHIEQQRAYRRTEKYRIRQKAYDAKRRGRRWRKASSVYEYPAPKPVPPNAGELTLEQKLASLTEAGCNWQELPRVAARMFLRKDRRLLQRGEVEDVEQEASVGMLFAIRKKKFNKDDTYDVKQLGAYLLRACSWHLSHEAGKVSSRPEAYTEDLPLATQRIL